MTALLLGPVYAAGSLAEERSGRTLPLILSCGVASFDIVTARLWAALSRVGDLFLIGLPFSAFCILFGAVQLETVVAELLVALSVACAGSALALFIAVWCRRLVDSLVLTYVFLGLWCSLPLVNALTPLVGLPRLVPGALARLNPLWVTHDLSSAADSPWSATWIVLVFAVVAFGLAFWLGAIMSLRSASVRIEAGGSDRMRKGVWRFGIFRTDVGRSVWDRPALWRELRCRRPTLVERLVWIVFFAAVSLVFGLIVREWPASVRAMSAPASGGPPPTACIVSMVATFCHLAFIASPFLAVTGATAFADEREGHMDELLRLTDLRRSELVHAKLARFALLVLVLSMPPLLLASVMVAIGYSTWVSLLLVTANSTASLSFAVLLGLAIGVRSRKTSHAVATTIVLGLIGGFLIPVLSVASMQGGPSVTHYTLAMISPPIQCYFLMFYDTIHGELPPLISIAAMRIVALAWTAAYGLATFGLYLSSLWTIRGQNSREHGGFAEH
jgi:hypothetical protein